MCERESVCECVRERQRARRKQRERERNLKIAEEQLNVVARLTAVSGIPERARYLLAASIYNNKKLCEYSTNLFGRSIYSTNSFGRAIYSTNSKQLHVVARTGAVSAVPERARDLHAASIFITHFSSLTSNLSKSHQLLTTHRPPWADDRDPFQTS